MGDFLASARTRGPVCRTTELMPLLRGQHSDLLRASRTNTSRRCTRSPGMPLRPRCFANGAGAPGDVLAPPAVRCRARPAPPSRRTSTSLSHRVDRGLRHHQPDGNRDARAPGSRAAVGTGSGSGGARTDDDVEERTGGADSQRPSPSSTGRAFDERLRRGAASSTACATSGAYCSDLWSSGIARRAWLEAGRRLVAARSAAGAADHVLDAGVPTRSVALLTGTGSVSPPDAAESSPRGMPIV